LWFPSVKPPHPLTNGGEPGFFVGGRQV